MADSPSSIRHILSELMMLPEDWHLAGTVSHKTLRTIAKYTEGCTISCSMETGSGKTTLLFSHISQNHKVFAVDAGNKSIEAVRSSPLFRTDVVEFIEGPTQATLPKYEFSQKLQLALIDGPHGYPFPDLEYYYIYPHLEEGGLLIVDDIQIPTIRKMVDFLAEDDMFTLLEIADQTAFFRRTNSEVFNPFGDGWWLQQYNKAMVPPPKKAQPEALDSRDIETTETATELAELQHRLLVEVADQAASFRRTNAEIFNSFDDAWWSRQHHETSSSSKEELAVLNNQSVETTVKVTELTEIKRRLKKTQAQLKQARLELSDAQQRINAMESSKFWKLRKGWLKLKRKFGLTQET